MDKTINFSESFKGGWYIIGIGGRMDTNTASTGEEKIKAVLKDHIQVALDLSKLDYISSAGLRVLLRVAKIANKEKNCYLRRRRHGKRNSRRLRH